jgi:hypothetical protein
MSNEVPIVPNPNAPSLKERFQLEYKKHDDDIRHYSTTRSALTSFLMTVGLTLLAYNFSNSYPSHPWFFPVAGFAVLFSAVYACFTFSYRTERSKLHLKALWDWATGQADPKYPAYPDQYPKFDSPKGELKKEIYKKMRKDGMNPALIVVVFIIAAVFLLSGSCFVS